MVKPRLTTARFCAWKCAGGGVFRTGRTPEIAYANWLELYRASQAFEAAETYRKLSQSPLIMTGRRACLACGEVHVGREGLPCPYMSPCSQFVSMGGSLQ